VASASSLYPNEFCVRVEEDVERKGFYDCFFVNVGSESNAYRILVESQGKLIEVAKTDLVEPQKSVTQKLRLPPNLETITVEVVGKSKKELFALPN